MNNCENCYADLEEVFELMEDDIADSYKQQGVCPVCGEDI